MAETPKRSFNQRVRDRFFGRGEQDAMAIRDRDHSAAAGTGGDAVDPDAQPRRDDGSRRPAGLSATGAEGAKGMGFFGRVQRPGGFDAPPDEPVELEGPLPWELADSPDEEDDAIR
jgi:hypothetical protein